ncbi:MAG: hypothetical protein EOP04_01905 [Proteobacteria bacterium]|nr:MAG: hypothetical protein EOP04_01905 [Pseudomonadota bacterium]
MKKFEELRRSLEIALFSEPDFCLQSGIDLKKTSVLPIIRREKNSARLIVELTVSVRETLKHFAGVFLSEVKANSNDNAENVLLLNFSAQENFTLEYIL